MNYQLHSANVETTGCDIGGDEDGGCGFGRGEAFYGAHAGFLSHLRVQGVCVQIKILEKGCEASNGVDGIRED